MNIVDLLFIVDVTGSMGSFIDDAKQKMQDILQSLTGEYDIDLNVGLSLYRDHPSEDQSFVTVTFDLMDVKKIKDKISEIQVDGGGDYPEAVLDGIIDGANDMNWRDGSRRIAFLIGDAPPHGMYEYETHCLCGKTWGDAIIAVQDKGITLYSIVLGSNIDVRESFKQLSNFTGGMLIESDNAMNAITDTLKTAFDDINLDSKVLEMLSKDCDTDKICEMLNIDREKLSVSKSRLAQHTI